MTVVHTHFYIVVDTQRGCHTLKLRYTQFQYHIPLFFVLQTDSAFCEVETARPRLLGVRYVSKHMLYEVCLSVTFD